MLIETGREANPPKRVIKKNETGRRRCPFTTPPSPHKERRHCGRDAGNHSWKYAIGLHAMNVHFSRAWALRACRRVLLWNSLPMIAAKHHPALLQPVMSRGANKDYECNLAYGFA